MSFQDEHPGLAWQTEEAVAVSAALHREAEEAPRSPAPVEAVVRAGRRRVRRGRQAVVGTVAVVALALSAAPLLTDTGSAGPDVSPAAPSPAASGAGTHARLHTVEPYEPVEVAPGRRLGLLPEGRQNFLLVPTEYYEQALQERRSLTGDNIRRRSISGGYESEAAEGIRLVSGAWRLPEPPARITVTVAGRDHAADLYTLPGSAGWGVYVFDAASLPRFTECVVTAYDASGEAFDSIEIGTGRQSESAG